MQDDVLSSSSLNDKEAMKPMTPFYNSVLLQSQNLTDKPALPCQRHPPPRRLDDGSSPYSFDGPKSIGKYTMRPWTL